MNPSPATSAWCFSICTIGTPPCADASPERPAAAEIATGGAAALAMTESATGRVPRIGALTAGKTALAVRYGRQAIRRRSTAGTCSISGYANAGSSPAASLVILSLDIPERRGRAAAPARLYMAAALPPDRGPVKIRHSSQKEVYTTNEYSDFEYYLRPTFDFRQE